MPHASIDGPHTPAQIRATEALISQAQKWLEPPANPSTPEEHFACAVLGFDVEGTRALLEAGVPVDTPIPAPWGEDGPLFFLLNRVSHDEHRTRALALIDLLLSRGAARDQVSPHVGTLVFTALSNHSVDALDLLFQHGVPCGVDDQGNTALHHFVKTCPDNYRPQALAETAMRRLHAAGVPLEVTNARGETVLSLLASKGQPETERMLALVDMGAQVCLPAGNKTAAWPLKQYVSGFFSHDGSPQMDRALHVLLPRMHEEWLASDAPRRAVISQVIEDSRDHLRDNIDTMHPNHRGPWLQTLEHLNAMVDAQRLEGGVVPEAARPVSRMRL